MNPLRKAPLHSVAPLMLNLTLLLFMNGNVERSIASSATEESSKEPTIYVACNVEKYWNGSAFERNVNVLLDRFTRNAVLTGFNASTYGRGSSLVFGRLHCRGDLSPRERRACSLGALTSIRRGCPDALGARVQLEHCFLRYENYDFISKLDTNLWYGLVNDNHIPGPRFRIAVIHNSVAATSSETATI